METRRTASAVVLFSIVLLGLNLRPVLAAVGPVLDTIQAGTGLGHVGASLLTALPVFVMGIAALGGVCLQRLLGSGRGISLGIALIALSCAGRWIVPEREALIVTALVAGAGIAFVQALLPEFIKRRFPGRSSAIMGFYSTAIMAGAVIAAASSAWIAVSLGWPGALGVWALPALAALAAWCSTEGGRAKTLPFRNGEGGEKNFGAEAPAEEIPSRRHWYHWRAWTLMLFFGLGTCAYTLALAWLPPYYTALGWGAAESGYLLSGLTAMEVVAGLTVSISAARFLDRRPPSVVALFLQLAGLICLIVAPDALAWPACLLLGLGIGAIFPLSLIVALDHLDDPGQAGALLAFVQGGGYIVASLMPLVAGILREWFASLVHAWTLMAFITLLMLAMVLFFSPASYRRAFRR